MPPVPICSSLLEKVPPDTGSARMLENLPFSTLPSEKTMRPVLVEVLKFEYQGDPV